MTDTPDQPQARGVHIDASPLGAVIRLDGTPIPEGTVTGYVLQHDVNESLPRLILHTRQPGDVVFDGIAKVAVGVPQSPADVVCEFLSQVDPVLLDQQALNRSDYGGGPGATAVAMLQTLSEWARGQGGGHAGT